MFEFNSGTYKGDASIEKVASYRDGGLSIPVKVNNTPEAHVLLDNVNKICRVTFETAGKAIVEEGELMQLSTLRNGGIALSLFVKNEPKTAGKWLSNVKNSGTVTIEFSSIGGKKGPTVPEDENQPDLSGLEPEADPE